MQAETPDASSSGETPSVADRLDSWKEIAAYLKRDVRTIRRWEKAEALPIRRHVHGRGASVYAFRSELDAWWLNRHARIEAEEAAGQVEAPDESRGGRFSWRAALLTAALAVVAIVSAYFGFRAAPPAATAAKLPRSIVVMPLRNLDMGPEWDFVGLAVSRLIASPMSTAPQLNVRSSAWAFAYRDKPHDPKSVARELQVDLLLGGTYRRELDSFDFSLELLDATSGAVVWRGLVRADEHGLLSVPGAVNAQIARALGVPLPTFTASRQADRDRQFLRGVGAEVQGQTAEAARWQKQALQADPEFAPAGLHLASNYVLLCYAYRSCVDPASGVDQVAAAWTLYEKFLRSEAASPANLSITGLRFMEMGRLPEGVALLRRALEINPNHPDARLWLGQAYRYAGMLDESLAEARRALQLDPFLQETTTINTYLYLGDFDQFLQLIPDVRTNARTFYYRGLARLSKGDRELAEKEFARAYEIEPSGPHAKYGQALRRAIRGEVEQGRQLLTELEREPQPDGEMLFKVAQVAAVLGEKSVALRQLRKAVEADFVCSQCFSRDPLLARLREEPEFAEIVERARQRQEHFRKTLF